MKITVNSEKAQDNKLIAKVKIDAKDVDKAIAKAYKEIANKYNFQGFRKGKTPRPVIDGIVGQEAVLAQATNDLLEEMEPLMIEELNVVPVGQVSYDQDALTVKDGEDYEAVATITCRPECELESYDAPSITMPPENATEAEIEQQLDTLKGYHTTYEEVEEDRGVEDSDICSVNIEDVDGTSNLAGEDKLISMELEATPKEIKDALRGMKKGETKTVELTEEAKDGEEPKKVTIKITLNAIKQAKTPELTDEFVKESFGFDSVDALRDALKIEIENDKKNSLPSLKEERLVAELEKRLKLEETPKEYSEQVFQEIAQDFLTQLQRQGMSLDTFLQMRRITMENFLDDLHKQAEEHARQSLALDALAAKLKIEATEEDIKEEFEKAHIPNPKEAIEDFKKHGQLPAIRDSIKRTKALKWLCDNAEVTEVDEVAERKNQEK